MARRKHKPRWRTYRRYAASPSDWNGCPEQWHESETHAIHDAANQLECSLIEKTEKVLRESGMEYDRIKPMMDALRMRIWSEMKKRGWVVLKGTVRFAIPRRKGN